jgi:hypothetical protein
MFPIAKAALSILEISAYWPRELNPRASSKELCHILEAAWKACERSPLRQYIPRFRAAVWALGGLWECNGGDGDGIPII